MTEKRFDYEYNHNILAYILTDNGEEITSFDAEGVSDEDIKIIINLLNEQEETIQHLKAQLEKGNDVCSICKYEYLVASREFYISKCKKEHTECSKGTVDYCEDFELKEKEE